MAQFAQPEHSQSKTVLDRQTIRNVIDLIDPIDTPVLDYFGLSGANKFNFLNNPGTKLVWANDQYRQLDGVMAASMSSDATTLSMATNSIHLKIGDVVEVGSEKMWVSAADHDNRAYTVTRGFGSTTATTHASNAAVTIVGIARNEGADVDYGALETPTTDYNYTVILQESLRMTRNAMKKPQYGIDDPWQYQIDKKMPELFRMLEKKFFYGERVERSGMSTPSDTGGLPVFVTTHTLSTARTSLTINDLQNVMLSCHLAGGAPDIMIAHPSTILTLTNLYQTSQYLYIERQEDTVGMVIKFVETPWGRLRLLDGRHVPTGDLYFIQSEYVGVYEYDAFFWKDVPSNGDWEARQVIGEYALVVRNPDAHAYIRLT